VTTVRRIQGYRRVPIVTDANGTRNCCTPVSQELNARFEALAERMDMTKAQLLKHLMQKAVDGDAHEREA
jgi:hypothetical protein